VQDKAKVATIDSMVKHMFLCLAATNHTACYVLCAMWSAFRN